MPLLDRGLGIEARVPGRFVRIDMLGGMRTLWLAEVEAVAAGGNAARGGTARQKQPEAAGTAAAAIDGSADTATGTQADEDPWWEVDLGGPVPLERIVVRQAAGLRKDRLKNFTLEVLDADRRVLARHDVQADESLVTAVPLESGAAKQAAAVRRAAFQALAGVRGREQQTLMSVTTSVSASSVSRSTLPYRSGTPSTSMPRISSSTPRTLP